MNKKIDDCCLERMLLEDLTETIKTCLSNAESENKEYWNSSRLLYAKILYELSTVNSHEKFWGKVDDICEYLLNETEAEYYEETADDLFLEDILFHLNSYLSCHLKNSVSTSDELIWEKFREQM